MSGLNNTILMTLIDSEVDLLCAECGSSKTQKYLYAPAMDTSAGPRYQYYRCDSCGFICLDHKPSLSDYEDSGFYQVSENRFKRLLGPLVGVFTFLRFRYLKKYSKTPGRVVDIGCGRGRFLNVAKNNGWKVFGIEPNKRSASYAKEQFKIELLHGGLEDCKAKADFDAVTLWHVLEHFPTPTKIIRRAAVLLKKDGIMIIAVPNIKSLQGSIGREKWYHLDPPRHLSHFSPELLTKMMENNGLKVEAIHHYSTEYNFVGMVQTVQNRMQGSPNFIFNFLKRNKAALPSSGPAWAFGFISSAVVAVLSPFLLLLSIFEAMARMGGTITVVARKK